MDFQRHFLGWCLLSLAVVTLLGCERPPVETIQVGYRGTAMVEINNPRDPQPRYDAAEVAPASADGARAAEVYENVQVLGDLSVGQFGALMVAITSWVSPEQGCGYCHNLENLASDDMYTKIVSRRMIQMTQEINGNWQQHVGEYGVNCATCHRGNNVPQYIWFEGDDAPGMDGFLGNRNGQNRPAESVGYSSLPADPFTPHLTATDSDGVRVISAGAFPPPRGGASIQATESTYGLMMHFSNGLGVNCAYCHNSASFQNWESSTPQRITAWHGLQMVRHLNEDYLLPLQGVYPPKRLGPTGDAPKAYCATCHQGQNVGFGAMQTDDHLHP